VKVKKQKPPGKSAPTSRTARRRLWFRLTALAIPLAGLVVVECILRLGGFGYPTSFFLKTTVNGAPVFIENQQFSRRYFSPEYGVGDLDVVYRLVKARDRAAVHLVMRTIPAVHANY
jgi:hypothetical protein